MCAIAGIIGLGYDDAQLAELHAAGVYNTWEDLKELHHG